MKTRLCLFTVLISAAILWTGCTDLKNGLPAPVDPGVQAHEGSWVDKTSPSFHGAAIRNANWDMRSCKTCHGSGYDGGTSAVSCGKCHTDVGGPENCSTCHGTSNPAPPRDLSGNSSTSARGVGAHQRHVMGSGVTSSYLAMCNNCHVVPGAIYATGHVDTKGPAEVVLSGSLTTADPTGVPGPPAYNADSLSCSNTFCHGNWSIRKATSPYELWYSDTVMTGRNRSVRWTGGSAEVACGTCHGSPPTGHVSASLSTCGVCHQGIVNNAGIITDKVRHMNGKINVFGTERDF
jgi:predicted CxxxxCH...CXXCH cytochrome family protein